MQHCQVPRPTPCTARVWECLGIDSAPPSGSNISSQMGGQSAVVTGPRHAQDARSRHKLCASHVMHVVRSRDCPFLATALGSSSSRSQRCELNDLSCSSSERNMHSACSQQKSLYRRSAMLLRVSKMKRLIEWSRCQRLGPLELSGSGDETPIHTCLPPRPPNHLPSPAWQRHHRT